MDCSTPGFPVHHLLPELAQTHVHRVSDTIQPSHPLSSPFPPSLFPASGSFHMSPFFTSGGQSIEVSEVSIHYVETAQLRLGLESPVFSLGSHTWSQDSMKLRFFVSCCRKNSLRDKMIGKKWIYLDISWSVCSPFQKVRTALGETHSIVKVWAISEDKRPWNTQWLVIMGWVIS